MTCSATCIAIDQIGGYGKWELSPPTPKNSFSFFIIFNSFSKQFLPFLNLFYLSKTLALYWQICLQKVSVDFVNTFQNKGQCHGKFSNIMMGLLTPSKKEIFKLCTYIYIYIKSKVSFKLWKKKKKVLSDRLILYLFIYFFCSSIYLYRVSNDEFETLFVSAY